MYENVALLIIDMQNDVVKKLPPATGIIPGIFEILSKFRELNKPIFHIKRSYRVDGTDVELPRLQKFRESGFRVVEGTYGAEIVEQLKPKQNEYIITKSRWSGFFKTHLDLLLNRLKIKKVIITGVQTPNCVRSTAFDAISYDFDTIIIKDCTAAMDDTIHNNNLYDMAQIGIKISTKDELINNLVI